MTNVRYTGTLYVRHIPANVKDQFKAWCARRGLTLTEGIIQVMQKTAMKDERALTPKNRGDD